MQHIHALRVGAAPCYGCKALQFILCRNAAAHAHTGHCVLLVLVRASDDGVNLQPVRALDNLLDVALVFNTRQLHQNLVGAQAVLLNHRLADAQRIHAVTQGLNGLLDRLRLQGRQHRLLHGQRPCIVPNAVQVVLVGVSGRIQKRANGIGAGRRSAVHADHLRLGRIGHNHLGIAQVGLLQILLDQRRRIVGLGGHRLLDLNLQDQVRAAAQVQPKMNALGQAFRQVLAGDTRRGPEDAPDTNHQDSNNQGNFTFEILLHRFVSLVQKSQYRSKN